MNRKFCKVFLLTVLVGSMISCADVKPRQNVPQVTDNNPVLPITLEQLIEIEKKNSFAIFYYSNAAENGVDIFRNDTVKSDYEQAWAKCNISRQSISTPLGVAMEIVRIEYDFTVGKQICASNYRLSIRSDLNTEFAFTAARQAFEKLMAQKIISLKISEKETLADLLKRKDMESRYELALYLCRVAGGVEGMPKIKCKFPSLGGGYLELNKMANYSGRITYQLLFQDLADLFAQDNITAEILEKNNPDWPKSEMLNVNALASDARIQELTPYSPQAVFAPELAIIEDCLATVKK